MESPLTFIPIELTTEVLGRVASSSIADLYNAKLSCKELFGIAEEEYVHKQILLDKIPIIQWFENRIITEFLDKCIQCRNPEALFRKGVVDYFGGKNINTAVKCLEEASRSGHPEASYAMALILLFDGGESKQKGMKLLSGMQKSRNHRRKMKNCRKRLQSMVDSMLVDNPSIFRPQTACCVMGHHPRSRRYYWGEEIEEDEDITNCDACICDEEITAIRKSIRWKTAAYVAEN